MKECCEGVRTRAGAVTDELVLDLKDLRDCVVRHGRILSSLAFFREEAISIGMWAW